MADRTGSFRSCLGMWAAVRVASSRFAEVKHVYLIYINIFRILDVI